jgi:hypothetical protein
LQVGVEGDDRVPGHGLECGQDGLVLAEVARELEHADPVRARGGRRLQDRERPVLAAVVHEDELVGLPRRIHDGGEPGEQLRKVALLVVDGDDDGGLHRRNSARTSETAATASSWSASDRPGKRGSDTIRSETKWASG